MLTGNSSISSTPKHGTKVIRNGFYAKNSRKHIAPLTSRQHWIVEKKTHNRKGFTTAQHLMNWNTKPQRKDEILDLTYKGIKFQKLGIKGNWKLELTYAKGEDAQLEGRIMYWLQACLLPQEKKGVVLDRHVKVSQPGSHGLAHHELGWKWVNPTRLTLWWARNFVTRLNPPRVGGLSGLAHQPT